MSVLNQELDVLFAQLSQGHRSAFNPLFELLWPLVLAFCEKVLTDRADAKDAAQEVMYKIFDQASQYDTSRHALPWVYAIASWECRTIMRKRHRIKYNLRRLDGEVWKSDMEKDMISSQLMNAALAAMNTLSDVDKEVLVSTFWEKEHDVSGATWRKRRERALTRLREAFVRLYGLD